MSRPFESFEVLNRGWDVRVLEGMSLRKLFVMTVALVFVLGADFAVQLFILVRLRHFDWWEIPNLLVCTLLAFRYGRLIYRRLEH